MEENKGLAVIDTALTTKQFADKRRELQKFIKSQLKETKTGEGGDFGVIPYTKKMSLLKPGAEKLCGLYGFAPKYEEISKVEDWEKGFVYYKYKCTLIHIKTGAFVGDSIRSCNSKEKKHASKLVYDVANTVEAVAQKRALVAAVVQATGSSEIFDADIDDDEKDATPPNRPITKDEDPKRMRAMINLFRDAEDRGFTENGIKSALYKKFNVDSLTKIATNDIEKYYDSLVKTYRAVGKGNKPEKMTDNHDEHVAIHIEKESDKVVEGEVIEKKELYHCRSPKHAKDETILVQHMPEDEYQNPYFCNQECEDAYYPPQGASESLEQKAARIKNQLKKQPALIV